MAEAQPVLIDGQWRAAQAERTFTPMNPTTMEPTGEVYPVSLVEDVNAAVEAAAAASEVLLGVEADKIAAFLEKFADRIEARRQEIVAMAHAESGLPAPTRLDGIELPRTTDQLRQAAKAARQASWTHPTIDTQSGIRSMFGPLEGGVAVFGQTISRWLLTVSAAAILPLPSPPAIRLSAKPIRRIRAPRGCWPKRH